MFLHLHGPVRAMAVPLMRRFHVDRMVRHVVLQICKAEQQLKNLLAARSWLRCRENLHCVTRVSQEPIDDLLINGP